MEPGSFGVVVATQIEPGAAIARGTTEEETIVADQETNVPWQFECRCANLKPGGSPPAPEAETEETPEGFEHFILVHPDQVVIKVPVGVTIVPNDFGLQLVEPRDLFLSEEVADADLEEARGVLDFLAQEIEGHTIGIHKLINPEDDVFEKINQVQEKAGLSASPHYRMKPAPKWRYGPHSIVTRLNPALEWKDLLVTGPSSAPPGGRVVVIDTGANGNLSEIDVVADQNEAEPAPNPPNGLLPEVVGHGTFAASITKKYNPGLNVELYRASFRDGTFNEVAVLAAFFRARPAQGDVVSLSFGTYPAGPRLDPLILPIAIAFAVGAVVVAASGNDGSNHVPPQLYPASRPDVVGVSALDSKWQPAPWANPGDVYAPGEDVVGWHHNKVDDRIAVWSGTSFATPYYAACRASGVC